MATAFTESEKKKIDEKLRLLARQCLKRYGVKKTTVDQLVSQAGISKGAFYHFYPSKEALFFAVLEEYQMKMMEGFMRRMEQENKVSKPQFAELLYDFYQDFRHSFLLTLVKNHEIELLVRKISKARIREHRLLDIELLEKITPKLPIRQEISLDLLASLLTSLAVSCFHIDEIGEASFDQVLKIQIEGLVQQIFEEV